MNKKIISGIILSAMILSSTAAFAAGAESVILSSAQTAEETLLGVPVIKVNNEAIDLSNLNLSHYMFEENNNVMVPLRAIAEKIGYTVIWDAEHQGVSVGDDTWEVMVYIGSDCYVGASKMAIWQHDFAPFLYIFKKSSRCRRYCAGCFCKNFANKA